MVTLHSSLDARCPANIRPAHHPPELGNVCQANGRTKPSGLGRAAHSHAGEASKQGQGKRPQAVVGFQFPVITSLFSGNLVFSVT